MLFHIAAVPRSRTKVGGCERGIGGSGGIGPRCSGRRAGVEARGGAGEVAGGGEGARQQYVRRGTYAHITVSVDCTET